MKYSKIIGALFISGALLAQPIQQANAKGVRSSAARGISSFSSASRSASSVSRAAATARTNNILGNAALYATLGAVGSSSSSNSQAGADNKNPNIEIAKRIALINVATVSKDAVLIKEAKVARNELLGYQKLRAEKSAQRIAENKQDVIFDGLFDTKNPQDEIAQRINIIKLVGESNDPVLLQEAEYARNELMGYREYKLDNPQSTSRGKKIPKDEILNRINIIILAKDVDDAAVQTESDIASAELTGYQEYRAANDTKPIAESDYPQDEVDWRLSIIKIAQDFDVPVLTREADIAKSELTTYRDFKDGIVADDGEEEPKEVLAADTNQGITTDSMDWVAFAQYGVIGVFFLILLQIILVKKEKRDKERDKYLGKKKNIRW